jgi:AcrR family transcriptional regulator
MVNIIHQTREPRKRPEARNEGVMAKPVVTPTPIDRLSARAGTARAPGPRAMRTRVALLDATAALLREVPFHQLTSAHVTQRAGLSAAAFYRYFADLGDAIAALTTRMAESVHAIAELVRDADWQPEVAPESALLVIAAMEQFWSEHRPLYRVTDLLAEEGDPRFTTVKARTFAELTDTFAQVARRANDDRRPQLETRITAGIIVTTLIHTTAREVGFAEAGVPLAALRVTLARVVADVIRTCP